MITAVCGICYFIYALFNLDLKTIVIYSIFGLAVFTIPFLINAFTISEITLNENEIIYKHILSNKEHSINLKEVSHFTYYNRPVERTNYLPYLEIYIKTKYKHLNRMRVDLCLSKQERYSLLSKIHDKGFQVTLFDSLRLIQDTEYYVNDNN